MNMFYAAVDLVDGEAQISILPRGAELAAERMKLEGGHGQVVVVRIKVVREKRGDTSCLFDQLPPELQGQPMWLSCPCPKCSPWC